jgi:hypothetical protein
MKQSSPPRNRTNRSDTALRQLNLYALSATAAGVGMLALTQPAEATVIYRHVHHVIGKNARYKLDINQDGKADASFVNSYGCNTDYCYDVLTAIPIQGNGVEGKPGFLGIPYAYAVKPGGKIGGSDPFSGQLMASTNMGTIGQWVNVTDRYLGLKFKAKGKTHYGWARLNVKVLNENVTATLTGYAYETTPNKQIIAGKTKGPGSALSLGRLAQGASGISALRTQSAY